MHRVDLIMLSFDSKKENVDINEARKLMVDCVENYLERINQDKNVQPYLSHYPFTVQGINFRFSFRDEKEGALHLVFLSKGNIVYCIRDPDQAPLVRKHKEPYEEAKAIVMAEQQKAL